MYPRIGALAAAALGLLCSPAVLADEATQEEYEERLARYDFEANPDDHKKLASWCKRNYPQKFTYHERAYNRHVFAQEEADLPEEPSLSQLEELAELATKLGLPGKKREYLGQWGERQFAAYAKRLEPGNVKMMKQLLTWCENKQIAFIESSQQLAGQILEREPAYMPAREVLGHIQWREQWLSLEDAIGQSKILAVADRIELHKAAAAARARKESSYPTDPFDGMADEGGYYMFSPRKSPGARFYVVEQGYSRRKPCRLILSLHGGGSGGFEKSNEYAIDGAKTWLQMQPDGDHVVLIPAATEHVTNSWGTLSNVIEILNAMEEICERCNIDRKRIYITGQSMGGGGTTLWYTCFPELAAASCGRAGWFHHSKKQANLLGKPIMIIQGEKDEQFRVESKHKFLKMAENCNANVTNISYRDIDHFIPNEMTFPKFMPFFEENVNDIEPDFDVIRATAHRWLK